MTIAFVKMHGLGNDFVVIDARTSPVALSEAQWRAIADRRSGVGCDQLIVIEPPHSVGATAFMRIRNPDGSEAGACGNATRCVARVLMDETGRYAAARHRRRALCRADRGQHGQSARRLLRR